MQLRDEIAPMLALNGWEADQGASSMQWTEEGVVVAWGQELLLQPPQDHHWIQ